MHACLKCGVHVGKHFRLVLGNGRMERLCLACSDQLSTLVRTAGDTCQLSMADHRFVTWLETGHWPMRDGRTIVVDAAPSNGPVTGGRVRHGSECPCCATFAEDQD
jgi:hypothetical protein